MVLISSGVIFDTASLIIDLLRTLSVSPMGVFVNGVAMNSLLNSAFENDLVRVITKDDDEPWFVASDVLRCLDLRNNTSLDALDEDEKGTHTMGTPGGNQRVTVISEAGLFRLVFNSRKPIAEKFKRWLAHEVLPALRKTGKYELARAKDEGILGELAQWRERALADPRFALEKVRTAQRLYGKARARLVWEQLGLLRVPELPQPSPLEDSFACLRHLLGWTLRPSINVRDTIEAALDGDDASALFLQASGIRIRENPEGFFVANSHPQVQDIFLDTEWNGGRFRHALRGLPGGTQAMTMRYGFDVYRGTFVPERYLDDRYPRRAVA
jgi:prophage antirepressor-like protein